MIGLYSINLRIMGKSNIPLFNENNLFNLSKDSVYGKLLIILIVVILIKTIFDLFLKTKSGYLLVAVGDNEQMVTTLGVNKNVVKVIGLMLSNSLVALAGGLTAQYQGFAEVSMGTGIVVMGLAAVIIGTSIFDKVSFIKFTTLSIFGAIIYKSAVAIVLKLGLNPNDLKLMTAIIVVVALSINTSKFKFRKNVKVNNEEVKDGESNVEDTRYVQGL